jgi:hypothetical protein
MFHVLLLCANLKDDLENFYDKLDNIMYHMHPSPAKLAALREARGLLEQLAGSFDVLFGAIEVWIMGMFNNSIMGMTHYGLQGPEDAVERNETYAMIWNENEDLANIEHFLFEELAADEAALPRFGG